MTGTMEGHWAVVTGAGSGIGQAVGLGLAAQGVHLCLVGRRAEPLQETAQLARAAGVAAECHVADLSRDEDLGRLLDDLRRLERLHLLVHSAGVFTMGAVAKTDVGELDQQYRVNLRAPYVLTQALLHKLEESGGQIVFINSSAGLAARAQVSQYAAIKHALKGFADGLRDEVNPAGVRVLSVFPGRTASPMQATVHRLEGRAYHPETLLQPADVADTVLAALLLPRTAEVTDINIRPLSKPRQTR